MAVPREEPYVWVTWISKLLAGESQCEWAAWFRAHHQYDKRASDFDVAGWTAEHTAMVRDRAVELRAKGYEVWLESQNSFRLRGEQGTVLAGKPDIIAAAGDDLCVIDCKTGAARISDQLQVMVYMLVLPHAIGRFKGRVLEGEVCYRNERVAVESRKITPTLRDLFRRTMHQVGGAAELDRVPSQAECRWCDITRADCPERIDADTGTTPGHDLF
jgi:hypothetical protein